MPNIFADVVKTENDHTNLLRNVMERDPTAAACVLTCLLGREFTVAETTALTFKTQHCFVSPNGREIPDLFIDGPNFRCLIEAKIDPNLGLTAKQRQGYPGCFEREGERHLCFLIPDGWIHLREVNEVRANLSEGVSVPPPKRWRELIHALQELSKLSADPILVEAIRFWKRRFDVENITSKERESLETWPGDTYLAIRKLQKTLDQARELFSLDNIKTELERNDIDEYGFYLMTGAQYVLWIGIWTKAADPMAYGFHSTNKGWLRPTGLSALPNSPPDYHLWPLAPETWDNPVKLHAQITEFLSENGIDLSAALVVSKID